MEKLQSDLLENQVRGFSAMQGGGRPEIYFREISYLEKRWILQPKSEYEGVFIRFWGRSDHYYPENPSHPFHEKNPGFGLEIQGGAGRFLPNEYWRFSTNFLRNTTGGLTGITCLSLEEPLFTLWEYSFSGGISSCIGFYGNRYAEKTIPVAGFFPTFSARQEKGSAITFTLLPKNPFVPFGKSAAGIVSADKPLETNTSQNQFGKPDGAMIFFEKRW